MALYHSPAGSDADYSALTLAQNVLNDAPSGRLYKALVETQMASSVYASNPFTPVIGQRLFVQVCLSNLIVWFISAF